MSKKVLFIYCSPSIGGPRGSISTLMGKTFKENYAKLNPKDEIIELDLNKEKVGTESLTNENFGTFWTDGLTDKYIQLLTSVDKVVLSAPMNNFNYSATLKNFIDRVWVARKAFVYKYDRNGESEGLMKHLKVQLLTTQGADFGWYPWGNHTENLRGCWEFIGATVTSPITIYGTNTPNFIKLKAEEVVNPYIKKISEATLVF